MSLINTGDIRGLDGAYSRVERASEHLADLESQIRIATDNEKSRLASQFNPYSSNLRQRTFSTIKYIPPKMWGILIGEIAYNLRSALDYLVYELYALDNGRTRSGTYFPIKKLEECPNLGKCPCIKGLSVEHLAIIKELQSHYGVAWLEHLNTVCNHDKHRLLTPTVNVTYSFVESGHVGQFEGLPGYVHSTKSLTGKSEMHVYADFSLYVTFSDGPGVIETLHKYILQARDTLDAFNSEFK
ncbi:hypothetical protein ACFLWS_02905 [Chloroflexota bacterium]